MSWAQVVSTPAPEKVVRSTDGPTTSKDARRATFSSESAPTPGRGSGGRSARTCASNDSRSSSFGRRETSRSNGFGRRDDFDDETGSRRPRGAPRGFGNDGGSAFTRAWNEPRGGRGGETRFRGGNPEASAFRRPTKGGERPTVLILRPDQVAKLTSFVRYKAADSRQARVQAGETCDWLESAATSYRLWESEYDGLMREGGVDQNPSGQAWIRANKSTALRIAHRDPACIVHAVATDPAFLKAASSCARAGSGYSKEFFSRAGFRFDNECVEGVLRECVVPAILSPDSFRDGEEMLTGLARLSDSVLWPETLSRGDDLSGAALLASELASTLPDPDCLDELSEEESSQAPPPRRTSASTNSAIHAVVPVVASRLWSDIVDEEDED